MVPPLLWRWHHNGPYSVNISLLSVLGLCLGIHVSSWNLQNFYAHGAVTTRRASNQALRSTSSLNEDQLGRDSDSSSSKKGESAKFSISGSICGQKHEYLLDNLNCSTGNEIKFCGASDFDPFTA